MEKLNTVKILKKLVSFPTVSRDANLDLIEYIYDMIKCEKVNPVIIKNKENTKANLFASIGPENNDGVMLSGHTDVVPIDGQNWTKQPFECTYEDGFYFGRGTADMMGFVASAVNSFIKAKTKNLNKPLYLALSYDEEVGCLGVRSLIDLIKYFLPSFE